MSENPQALMWFMLFVGFVIGWLTSWIARKGNKR